MDNKLSVFMQQHSDVRSEIKQRIAQRDTLAIQCFVLLGGIITLAVANNRSSVLMISPFIMMYYLNQIFESYNIHDCQVEYLRNIETQIAQIIQVNPDNVMWESYYKKLEEFTVNGITENRKALFSVISVLCPILLGIIQVRLSNASIIQLYFIAVYYLICMVAIACLIIHNHNKLRYTGLNKLAYCDYLKNEDRTDEKTKAIFFDKDGTLHEDKVMTHRWRDLVLLPGAKEIVRYAHENGYLVIIVTNQTAIGKGIYSVSTMHRFIWLLRKKLKWVDAVYYCPHKFGVECNCRKPKTGMFERAVKELNVSLEDSIMVGDRESDVIAGKKAGVGRNILVTTGLYNDDSNKISNVEIVHSLDEIEF